MNSFTIILLFIAVLYASAATDPRCSVCDLNGDYSEAHGYGCIVIGTSVYCSCPGGPTQQDAPCRLCNFACNTAHPQHQKCLETSEYGTGYACLCANSGVPYTTTDYNCDPAATVTKRPTAAATTPPGGVSSCVNGGVLVGTVCQCPSGYSGPTCSVIDPAGLCRSVTCKNNGVCAIRSPSGQYAAVCLCRYGTWGDYCELNGTLGYCSSSPCLNGAACLENVVGTTRHAYCRCQPGYSGVKCEKPYFTCRDPGNFLDVEMSAQGKYFSCTRNPDGSYKIEQKSCGKGLRFNTSINQCSY